METSPSVIILDSDSDDGGADRSEVKKKTKPASAVAAKNSDVVVNENGKRPMAASPGAQEPQPVVRKRIKPVTIATNVNNNLPVGMHENFAPITYSEDWEHDMKQYQKELTVQSSTATTVPPLATPSSSRSSTTNDELDANPPNLPAVPSAEKQQRSSSAGDKPKRDGTATNRNGEHLRNKNPVGKEFLQLLDACRKADPSKEMETLIEKKLLRYYRVVHPDYINSKSFIKAVTQVTADVLANPTLVFLKLSSIVEELNVRRKSGVVPPRQPSPSHAACGAGDAASANAPSGADKSTKKDRQIAKLNRTLYLLTKRIKQLEETDVDFNHEVNSAYVMAERYKKRAFDVYEKLCDITGESKNAHRLVRKPIRFEGTTYTEFNHTLQLFVNQTNTFPNFRDVLKCLQHCNAKVGYGLRPDQMNRIAQDAFYKIGRQLQKRRKTDLYETVVYHAGEEKDPALIDPNLKKKLEDNGKQHYGKVNQIIEKYAQHEYLAREDSHAPSENTEEKSAPASEKATVTISSSSSSSSGSSSNSSSSSSRSSDTTSQNAQPSKPSSSRTEKGTSSSATAHSGSLPSATGGSNQLAGSTHFSEELELLTETDGDDEDDDDDDDEDDEEEDEFESTTKENVRPDNFEDIVISDDDELIVPES